MLSSHREKLDTITLFPCNAFSRYMVKIVYLEKLGQTYNLEWIEYCEAKWSKSMKLRYASTKEGGE